MKRGRGGGSGVKRKEIVFINIKIEIFSAIAFTLDERVISLGAQIKNSLNNINITTKTYRISSSFCQIHNIHTLRLHAANLLLFFSLSRALHRFPSLSFFLLRSLATPLHKDWTEKMKNDNDNCCTLFYVALNRHNKANRKCISFSFYVINRLTSTHLKWSSWKSKRSTQLNPSSESTLLKWIDHFESERKKRETTSVPCVCVHRLSLMQNKLASENQNIRKQKSIRQNTRQYAARARFPFNRQPARLICSY